MRETQVRRRRSHGAVCFHFQQCAEKYMKAVLADAGLPIPRIHDLVALRAQAVVPCPALSRISGVRLARLSSGAIEYRYPGGKPTPRLAAAAANAAGRVRRVVREAMGI
ncbi:MAG: HEPN domain-containing protein [Planctomycetes bacterium]|nr:HEPN domain-containing protein [Planctomycetota bacterium]